VNPEPVPTAPARLVIRAPNWLGDAVMALPAMGAVRAAFPQAHIAVAAVAAVAPLFEEETAARQNEIVIVTRATETAAMTAGGFDTALLFPNSFRSAWAVRRGGVGERWGYAGNLRSPLLTRTVATPPDRVHQSRYYADLVRGLGLPVAESPPRVSVRQETAVRAQALFARQGITGGRIVGFAPGAAYGHAKRWPPGRVAEVIARLIGGCGATCVLVGAAGDRDAAREIESTLPSHARVVDLIGRTDLRLLAGVLALCDVFVSNDSGAMHLAAALGVRVVAIFGPTDDRVTAPPDGHDVLVHPVFCRPCMLRDCPIDHRCMKGITSDAVFDVVAARLGARLPGGSGQ
jgi:lipopolysaccharide heptosyltransferase II